MSRSALAVEQQAEPLGMVSSPAGVAPQFGEGAGHAVQLECSELVEGGMVQHDVSSVEVAGPRMLG